MENYSKRIMKRIAINHPDVIHRTLLALKNNQIIAYPTDTIYGIGTDIDNDLGINKINHLKNRQAPMSIITHSLESLSNKLVIPLNMKNKMDSIIAKGDTCIVEYKSNSFNSLITKNNMIGFRVPNYPFLTTLLSEYNKPITTTSINTTGQEPVNNPDEIEKMFGSNIDLIIDGGIINNKSASKIYMFDKDNISQIR